MNEIVLSALNRPYTFVPLAILITLFSGLAVCRTPTSPEKTFTATFRATARKFEQDTRTSVIELAANNPPPGLLEGQQVRPVGADPNRKLASARPESP
jgi:hypothetical protein